VGELKYNIGVFLTIKVFIAKTSSHHDVNYSLQDYNGYRGLFASLSIAAVF
jgi:hypothetical protein